MPSQGEEVEEEIIPHIDIKSRIAAFSQGNITSQALPTPTTLRSPSTQPNLRKTPSTSQLLPIIHQRHLEQLSSPKDGNSSNHHLKPSHALLSNRPRSLTGDLSRPDSEGEGSRSSSPKLGIKSIIALYGQSQPPTVASSSLSTQSREVKLKAAHLVDDSKIEGYSSASRSYDSAKNSLPPPALPPRPRTNVLLSQSNTGSSTTSSSSNSFSGGHHNGSASPTSTYTPYVRKNLVGGTQSPTASIIPGQSHVPALPPRSWAAKSSEDLRLSSSDSNRQSTQRNNTIGLGPAWASSSSGNLTMQSEGLSTAMSPPAVPPRATATSSASTTSTSTLIPPPPPKRANIISTPQGSPSSLSSRINRSTSGPIAAGSSLGGTKSSKMTTNGGHAPRSSLSSIPISSSTSTVIAPPPRHIDTRRFDPGTHVSNSSTSSLRSVKQAKNKKKRIDNKRAELVYSREAGEAEQRYANLFDSQIKKQEKIRGRGDGRLDKKIVVMLWKHSQLEDWFLARVWDHAVESSASNTARQDGLTRESFVKAMSAIDFELQRRMQEREVQSRI